ncbi:hypothetical protein [Pontibacter pudoricolor]|uniref:hypothetical protein n=1 Tax=Pontibacter pudoricolor TaxID=2694930 RepID=UPI001391FCF6|nr:hypothetical protein [Pontibacter pudoricolor]
MLNQTMIQAYSKQIAAGFSDPSDEYLTENLQVIYSTSTEILHVKWFGEVGSKEFRDGYSHILRMVRVHKPSKWILDLSNRELINKEDQHWVFKNIFPQILRMLKQDVFIAVILPVPLYESLIHNIDGDDFIDNDNLLIMNHFLYYEESLRWLAEVQVADIS